MVESKFMKEFFIISSLYRKMSTLLKNKMLKHNISINETQLTILYILNNNETLSPNELIEIGQFNMSSLLFNVSYLTNEDFLNVNENDENNTLKNTFNISNNGADLLKDIDNICNKYFNNEKNNIEIYELLSKYEKKLDTSL